MDTMHIIGIKHYTTLISKLSYFNKYLIHELEWKVPPK